MTPPTCASHGDGFRVHPLLHPQIALDLEQSGALRAAWVVCLSQLLVFALKRAQALVDPPRLWIGRLCSTQRRYADDTQDVVSGFSRT